MGWLLGQRRRAWGGTGTQWHAFGGRGRGLVTAQCRLIHCQRELPVIGGGEPPSDMVMVGAAEFKRGCRTKHESCTRILRRLVGRGGCQCTIPPTRMHIQAAGDGARHTGRYSWKETRNNTLIMPSDQNTGRAHAKHDRQRGRVHTQRTNHQCQRRSLHQVVKADPFRRLAIAQTGAAWGRRAAHFRRCGSPLLDGTLLVPSKWCVRAL